MVRLAVHYDWLRRRAYDGTTEIILLVGPIDAHLRFPIRCIAVDWRTAEGRPPGLHPGALSEFRPRGLTLAILRLGQDK
jgi:hypothetical protein